MRVLLTGHNGFKGTWFTTLLKYLGHEIVGVALPSEPGHLSKQIDIHAQLSSEHLGDIRNLSFVNSSLHQSDCDLVVHFAAQSLVRESYRRPRQTFETNVNGTLNILQSVQDNIPDIPVLVITTDKVYRNDGRSLGYTEEDQLGGEDPYSASKAMADLLAQSWQHTFPNLRIAIARAGNVVGGGDTCKERLLPDLIASHSNNETPRLRYPDAIRPWQHVLDCLNGYLAIIEQLQRHQGSLGAWNIGPDIRNARAVSEVTKKVAMEFEVSPTWEVVSSDGLKEASLLLLDSSKARKDLGWTDKLSFDQAIEWTVQWHKKVSSGEQPLKVMMEDIEMFLDM